jgi:predicted permease
MRLNLPESKYPLSDDQLGFHRTLSSRLGALAGVVSTGIVSSLPLGGFSTLPFEVQGSNADAAHAPRLNAIIADSGYFRVVRATPKRGRIFNERTGTLEIVVNESFAAQYWPGVEALGKQLRLVKDHAAQPWLTVVGVIPDILQNFRSPLQHDPLIYLPYAQESSRETFIVSRTSIPSSSLAEEFRRVVQGVDQNLAVYEVQTLETRISQNRLSVSLLGGTFAVFAAIALVLAALGLYAVMAHSISQRTQEIGVRMALGGSRRDILRLVYLQGMRPMLLGMGFGLPAAYGVTHVLRMVLIGVSPGDPITLVSAVLVLAAAGILGCAVPARRASTVDPIVALRYE